MNPMLLDLLSFLMLLGALIAVSIAGLAWSGSRREPAHFFALFMASIFVWCFFAFLEFRVPVPEDMIVYHRCIFIGVSSTPYWFLLFVCSFAGRPLGRIARSALALPHALAIALAFGYPRGGFFWTFSVTETGVAVEQGPVYWIAILYIVAISLVSLFLLFRFAVKTKGVMRSVLLAMACILFIPLGLGVLSSLDVAFSSDLFDLNKLSRSLMHPRSVLPPSLMPVLGGAFPISPLAPGAPMPFDPTPLAFVLSGSVIGILLRRFNILDYLPFAKNLIFDAIKHPILAVDMDGAVMGANAAAVDLFPRLSVFGVLPLSSLCPEAVAVAREGGLAEWSGKGRHFNVVAHKLNASTRSPSGAVVFFYDVTDYHNLLEELRAAREKADSLAASKGRFLASMSHEIRTPLNAIIGLTELSLRTPLSPDQRENLVAVVDAGHRLLDLVNDVLDLSKIEAQAMRLEHADFDLPASLRLVTRTMKPLAEAKGLGFDLAIGEGVPAVVRGDTLRLGQIVTNLVSNAIKFTNKGGVVVTVSPIASVGKAPAGEPGRSVGIRVTVRDTGIGIARNKMGSIFESFSQADDSTSRRFGGTGLGLPICRELVGLFGGELSVESELGVGSAFTFTAFFEPGDPSRLPAGVEEPPEPSGAGRLSVLVVEDNPVNARVAMRWLDMEGHEAVHASSGTEALRLLSGKAFDLVLLDVEMPDMSGYDVAKRIRAGDAKGPSGVEVPIVAMTAHSGAEARDACAKAGMDGFVGKPVDFRDLAAILSQAARRAFRTRSALRDLSGAAQPPAASDGDLVSSKEPIRRLGGDGDLYRELLAIFVSEEGARAAGFREALERDDSESLRRQAHGLRGSAKAVGAEPLAAAAERLESAAAEAGADALSLAPLVEAMLDLLERTAHCAGEMLPPGYSAPVEE